MNIVICDDDQLFGQNLTDYINTTEILGKYSFDNFSVKYICAPKELLKYVSTHTIDILFLDISMPEMDGFELAEALQSFHRQTCIIFISSFDDKVFYSMRFRPFRFIRKSNFQEETREALTAAFCEITKEADCIMIRNHNDCSCVRIVQIEYAEKEKQSNYVNLYCPPETYRYRTSFSEIEKKLQNYAFIKAGPSILVNMNMILKVEDGTIYLSSGKQLPIIGRKYLSAVADELVRKMRG